MEREWIPLPLSGKLFANLDETSISRAQTRIENGWINESGGHSRFPGIESWINLPDNGRVYLHDWRDDLMASTSLGRLYRIDRSGNVEDVTNVPVSGGMRTIFAKTEDELVMAAGKQIVRFAGQKTEVLSEDAPLSTHVGYIDGYLVAIERDSGRFRHSAAGTPRVWEDLDTFAADGSPDNLTSMIVTPFRELLVCGPDSIEQFERLSSGDVPFFRRWSVAEGITQPYTLMFADNVTFGVNKLSEQIRFTGQTSKPVSDDIAKVLAGVDDWTDAWIGGFPALPLSLIGQKFLLLQAPFATNPYGTKGLTFIFDIRSQQFASLFGWDDKLALPTRWPGWSYWSLWGETFVGGEGKIYKFNDTIHSNAGQTQRWLVRTGHWDGLGEASIDNLRLRIKRGVGSNETEPKFMVRCNRDNRGFGRWNYKGLGRLGNRSMEIEFGGFGIANSFQWEFACTDDCEIELVKAEVQASPVGH